MTRIRDIKTTFTAGEVNRELLGRGDLRAYENGALTLQNVFINPIGGVTRRAGLGYIDAAAGDGKLIAFEFNTQQTYLLVVTDAQIDIYLNGVKETTLASPWTLAQIPHLASTQSADTLLLTHPDVAPKTLSRSALGTWTLSDWEFFTDANITYQPYYKFASSTATLTPSGTTGSITLTASEDVFTANHENTRLRVEGLDIIITDYDSPTVVTGTVVEKADENDVLQGLPDTNPTIDWFEQAFSEVRGYPISVAFHQDRLVVGGSRDLPNRLWFSKSGDLFNFDLGEGLDDESIEFAILSDQVNAIRGIFSGRHLQVFTSGAEWMVTGTPLTPASVQITRQTRQGSVIDRMIQPLNVDGATMYIARNKAEVHEFVYTDVEQAYQSSDLALLSKHLINNPIAMDYDQKRRLLFIIMDDGSFVTLTVYRAEEVAAWTKHDSTGSVKSVAAVGDDVFMLMERGGAYSIEQFDDALNLDAALTGEVGSPATIWSGLDHLEGQTVSIVADGEVKTPQIVSSGSITLNEPASTIEVGLPFTHIVEPLPPSETSAAGGGRKIRLIEAIFRLQDTQSLALDIGRGLADVPLRQLGEDEILDAAPPNFSGDIPIRALGWHDDMTAPLWRIEQDDPLAFTLLSVVTQIKVND
ncbi:MAG: hypothetical protein ACRBCT_04835 [Alphaproteobacteria bacterium]